MFDSIQTVDSLALAQRLDRIAGELNRRIKIMLEVNLGDESSKSGVRENEVPEVAAQIAKLPNLNLHGLMSVPPFLEPVELVRPYFSRLRTLQDKTRQGGLDLHDLSMGMSHDFEIAIEEGATIIRIGTALFGPRR